MKRADKDGLSPNSPQIENSAFSGFTAPESAPGQDVSRATKPQFEKTLFRQTELRAKYESLLRETWTNELGQVVQRWDWRKAAFIAWSSLPRKKRKPKTQAEFADLVGLTSDRTIRQWCQDDPEIDKRIAEWRNEIVTDHLADVLQAAVDCAVKPEAYGHQDRKMLLEMAGLYKSRSSQEITGKDNGDVIIKVVYADKRTDSNTSDSAS